MGRGAPPDPGLLRVQEVAGGADETAEVFHDHGLANELTSVAIDAAPAQPILHDAAGNLVWDGRFFYQYDGLNRLVQVNHGDQLSSADFDATGKLLPEATGTPGALLTHLTYDGLGRLIRTQRADSETNPNSQVEDYYYDGVRRVQEIECTWPSGAANSIDRIRDYVWGTGYADEILCQLDRGAGVDPQFADLYYYLQDANYNVAAALDDSANVLLQYTYDPYGNLAAIDVDPDGVLGVGDPPHNAIAHQGLFFERFFGSAADLLADAALAPADVLTGAGPAGLYHNRNRWYSPDLGRFITRDPNESALPIVVALTRNGESWSILLGAFDATAHYADGMNLYLYLGGNPINGLDALGLNWNDPFDEVDDFLLSVMGERIAAGRATSRAARRGLVLLGSSCESRGWRVSVGLARPMLGAI